MKKMSKENEKLISKLELFALARCAGITAEEYAIKMADVKGNSKYLKDFTRALGRAVLPYANSREEIDKITNVLEKL